MKFSILILTLLTSSCASNTGTGVLTGGILGAGIGGILGNGKGSLIGTATGVITGGLIGAALDQQDRKVMQQKSPRTIDRMDRNEPLTISDVIKLSQGGVSDDTIIQYIVYSSSYYHLSQTQIRRLQEGGVSRRVINEMIASGR